MRATCLTHSYYSHHLVILRVLRNLAYSLNYITWRVDKIIVCINNLLMQYHLIRYSTQWLDAEKTIAMHGNKNASNNILLPDIPYRTIEKIWHVSLWKVYPLITSALISAVLSATFCGFNYLFYANSFKNRSNKHCCVFLHPLYSKTRKLLFDFSTLYKFCAWYTALEWSLTNQLRLVLPGQVATRPLTRHNVNSEA